MVQLVETCMWPKEEKQTDTFQGLAGVDEDSGSGQGKNGVKGMN